MEEENYVSCVRVARVWVFSASDSSTRSTDHRPRQLSEPNTTFLLVDSKNNIIAGLGRCFFSVNVRERIFLRTQHIVCNKISVNYKLNSKNGKINHLSRQREDDGWTSIAQDDEKKGENGSSQQSKVSLEFNVCNFTINDCQSNVCSCRFIQTTMKMLNFIPLSLSCFKFSSFLSISLSACVRETTFPALPRSVCFDLAMSLLVLIFYCGVSRSAWKFS